MSLLKVWKYESFANEMTLLNGAVTWRRHLAHLICTLKNAKVLFGHKKLDLSMEYQKPIHIVGFIDQFQCRPQIKCFFETQSSDLKNSFRTNISYALWRMRKIYECKHKLLINWHQNHGLISIKEAIWNLSQVPLFYLKPAKNSHPII